MAGKAKFDQEAAFKSIIGQGQQSQERREPTEATVPTEKKGRVQRAYFLDRDIDKALKRKALEDEKNITETINEILRKGLTEFL